MDKVPPVTDALVSLAVGYNSVTFSGQTQEIDFFQRCPFIFGRLTDSLTSEEHYALRSSLAVLCACRHQAHHARKAEVLDKQSQQLWY